MIEGREWIIQVHIERLPEGVYLVTSEDVPGLVAQGCSIADTLEIACDVARKLIDAQVELELPEVNQSFDDPLLVG